MTPHHPWLVAFGCVIALLMLLGFCADLKSTPVRVLSLVMGIPAIALLAFAAQSHIDASPVGDDDMTDLAFAAKYDHGLARRAQAILSKGHGITRAQYDALARDDAARSVPKSRQDDLDAIADSANAD